MVKIQIEYPDSGGQPMLRVVEQFRRPDGSLHDSVYETLRKSFPEAGDLTEIGKTVEISILEVQDFRANYPLFYDRGFVVEMEVVAVDPPQPQISEPKIVVVPATPFGYESEPESKSKSEPDPEPDLASRVQRLEKEVSQVKKSVETGLALSHNLRTQLEQLQAASEIDL